MGCSNNTETLTNSTKISQKQEKHQNDNNKKWNEINTEQQQNINHESILQVSSQSPNIEENKNSISPSGEEGKEGDQDKQSQENKNLSPREQLRKNPNFVPIEKLDKKAAYLQFLNINEYLLKKKTISEPFDWFDENVEQKLIDSVKNADHEAQVVSDFILDKAMFHIHPETMPMYVEALKLVDYKWQLLNRILLIYQTYKETMDIDTMALISGLKKKRDKE